jgi:hypothetical protein
VGVLDADLRTACLGAMKVQRDRCREFALDKTWTHSARCFLRLVHAHLRLPEVLQADPFELAADAIFRRHA